MITWLEASGQSYDNGIKKGGRSIDRRLFNNVQ